MGRIGYRKSRNGCVLCKKRRVKCDEKRPCSACEKNGVECSLMNTDEFAGQAKHSGRSSRASSGTLSSRKSPRGTNPSFPSVLDPDDGSSGMMDLELMHHWTTGTSCTIPVSPQLYRVFQEDIPRLALRFPYLLHQLLALSAFHIAHMRPDSGGEYTARASQHQSLAISGIREALSGEMTQDNSTAIYMTSAILMASTFASHPKNDRLLGPSCPLTGLLEIIPLVRGMSVIQKLANRQICGHPLQQFFVPASPSAEGDGNMSQLVKVQLEDLKLQLMASAHVDEDTKLILYSGIESFLESMLYGVAGRIVATTELRVVFHWPLSMTSDFLGLLHARHPAALAVFSYYCVVLRDSEASCWFLRGWAVRLADSISESLANSPWSELIQWPLAETRQYGEKHLAYSSDML